MDANGGSLRHRTPEPFSMHGSSPSHRSSSRNNNDSKDTASPSGDDGSPAPCPSSNSSSRCHVTLTSDEVGMMFREPYIHTGYRLPDQPWSYYVGSLFWIHNETGNVWTHLLGSLFLLARCGALCWQLTNDRDPGDPSDGLDPRLGLPVCLGLCALASNVLSAVAHLFHSRSPQAHQRLFMLDYMGVSYNNLGSAVWAMYCGSSLAFFARTQHVFLPAVTLLACFVFFVCLHARHRYKGHRDRTRRRILLVAVTSFATLTSWPVVVRYVDCVTDADCSVTSLNHILAVYVFFIFNAVAYSAHVPERFLLGWFDIWGHGHQWFHVGVSVSQQLQLHAISVELLQRQRPWDSVGSLGGLLGAMAVTTVIEAFTLRCYMASACSNIQTLHDRDVKRQ